MGGEGRMEQTAWDEQHHKEVNNTPADQTQKAEAVSKGQGILLLQLFA